MWDVGCGRVCTVVSLADGGEGSRYTDLIPEPYHYVD